MSQADMYMGIGLILLVIPITLLLKIFFEEDNRPVPTDDVDSDDPVRKDDHL